MLHERKRRRRLSPVLADEPLVGKDLTRRLRVVLVSVVIAFVLTNLTSYIIGQAVRADAERDNRARIAALEQEFAADFEERRLARDRETARQDAELRQLRADACTLADRITPRDEAVQKLRQRYGCTEDARPSSAPGPASGPPATGRSTDAGQRDGAARPGSQPSTNSPRPPAAPSPKPPTSPTPPSPPPPAPDDGLICLPLLGCVL